MNKNRVKKEFIIYTSFMGLIVWYGLNVSQILRAGTDNVVVDKDQNKIVFKSIDKKDSTLRVIQFANSVKGMEYYNAIKVGDTLKIAGIKKDLVYKNYYKLSGSSRIRTINGKSLSEIKKIAERNALIRQVREYNQRSK